MHNVLHDFQSPESARETLAAALKTSVIQAQPSVAAGTTCKLTLRFADASIELFAVASAAGYRLTEDPAELRHGFQSFLDKLPAGAAVAEPAAEPAADAVAEPVADAVAEPVADAVEETNLESHELDSIQQELGTNDPLLAEVKRIQKLALPQKIRLAEEGELIQRTLLLRMYGKLVFDGLLRNPRLTEMEVAKLAKLGTLPLPLLQLIGRRTEWLRTERIRNALLGNPRTPQGMVQKIVSMLTRQEIKLLAQRRDFSPAAQAAIREQNLKFIKG